LLRRQRKPTLARELLERYCGTQAPTTPELSIERGATRLTFRLHQQTGDSDAKAEDGDWLIVMREVSDNAVIEAMSLSLKLTAKEAVVLGGQGQDQQGHWRHSGQQPDDGEETPGTHLREDGGGNPHGGGEHGHDAHTAVASAV
jgi:hypothetical protein